MRTSKPSGHHRDHGPGDHRGLMGGRSWSWTVRRSLLIQASVRSTTHPRDPPGSRPHRSGTQPDLPRQPPPRSRRPHHRPRIVRTCAGHPRGPTGTRPPRHQAGTTTPCGSGTRPEGSAIAVCLSHRRSSSTPMTGEGWHPLLSSDLTSQRLNATVPLRAGVGDLAELKR